MACSNFHIFFARSHLIYIKFKDKKGEDRRQDHGQHNEMKDKYITHNTTPKTKKQNKNQAELRCSGREWHQSCIYIQAKHNYVKNIKKIWIHHYINKLCRTKPMSFKVSVNTIDNDTTTPDQKHPILQNAETFLVHTNKNLLIQTVTCTLKINYWYMGNPSL